MRVRTFLQVCLISLIPFSLSSQAVSINTNGDQPHNSAILDVQSVDKGLLIPCMSTSDRMGIVDPAAGLLVFDTLEQSFWYFRDTGWAEIQSGTAAFLSDTDQDTRIHVEKFPDEDRIRFDLEGDEAMTLIRNDDGLSRLELGSNQGRIIIGEDAATNLKIGLDLVVIGRNAYQSDTIGATNIAIGSNSLKKHVDGTQNIAIGHLAMENDSTGFFNVGIGIGALRNKVVGNSNVAIGFSSLNYSTGDSYNTALGAQSMRFHRTGARNTSIGAMAMQFDSAGINNTTVGYSTLQNNKSGSNNTALGFIALFNNSTGEQNTALGSDALYSNTTGSHNVAIGSKALYHNSNVSQLVAIGDFALYDNTTGVQNTAVGASSLANNTTGSGNTALGCLSLDKSTTGDDNTAVGDHALQLNTTGYGNVAMGAKSLFSSETGSQNVSVGAYALYSNKTGINNIALGYRALDNNVGKIGNIAIGTQAMQYADNTTANEVSGNIAIGSNALRGSLTPANNDGTNNIAIGAQSLLGNASGFWNTSLGYQSMQTNSSGYRNVGVGVWTLRFNTSGYGNVTVGSESMTDNQTGFYNTAVGYEALHKNVSGDYNVTIGTRAMPNNTTGNSNTIIGTEAGFGASGSSYSGNVFIGRQAGYNETASNRLHINNDAGTPLIYGEFNNDLVRINGTLRSTGIIDIEKTGVVLRADGDEALWTDGTYFSWGFGASWNYFNDDMRIGGPGNVAPKGDIHIADGGNASIVLESTGNGTDAVIQFTDNASTISEDWTLRRDDSDGGNFEWRHSGFHKMTIEPAGNVGIGANATNPNYLLFVDGTAAKPGGGSWTNSSDRRLKRNINSYEHGLNELLRIEPVTFQYNALSGYDTHPEHVGVIAQELQKIAPYMVSTNEKTGYLDVNNSAMTYMLVNAVKELSDENESLKTQLEQQAQAISDLQAQFEAFKTKLPSNNTVSQTGSQ